MDKKRREPRGREGRETKVRGEGEGLVGEKRRGRYSANYYSGVEVIGRNSPIVLRDYFYYTLNSKRKSFLTYSGLDSIYMQMQKVLRSLLSISVFCTFHLIEFILLISTAIYVSAYSFSLTFRSKY